MKVLMVTCGVLGDSADLEKGSVVAQFKEDAPVPSEPPSGFKYIFWWYKERVSNRWGVRHSC